MSRASPPAHTNSSVFFVFQFRNAYEIEMNEINESVIYGREGSGSLHKQMNYQ